MKYNVDNPAKINPDNIKACSFEELNSREQKFIDHYLSCGDYFAAYERAGYSVSGRGWKKNARAKFKQLNRFVDERLDMRVGEGALIAFKVVKELMENAESEAVRLNAAKDYLTRAGHDRVVTRRVEVEDKRQLTDKELDGEIAALTAKVGRALGEEPVKDQGKDALPADKEVLDEAKRHLLN